MTKRREKRHALPYVLSAEDRSIEEEAYNDLAPTFNDPMWVEKNQDWYMVGTLAQEKGTRYLVPQVSTTDCRHLKCSLPQIFKPKANTFKLTVYQEFKLFSS